VGRDVGTGVGATCVLSKFFVISLIFSLVAVNNGNLVSTGSGLVAGWIWVCDWVLTEGVMATLAEVSGAQALRISAQMQISKLDFQCN